MGLAVAGVFLGYMDDGFGELLVTDRGWVGAVKIAIVLIPVGMLTVPDGMAPLRLGAGNHLGVVDRERLVEHHHILVRA